MQGRRTVSDCVAVIAAAIAQAADRPRSEAEIMLAERFGKDRLWVLTHPDAIVECDDEVLRTWVERRRAHEPLEYIFNKVSFYSQTFFIAQGALIPRPETELLIDKVLERVDAGRPLRLCEVGVGSGAVSIVLAQHLPKAAIVAVDISEDALSIAAKNVEAFGLSERITLRKSDLLDAVDEPIDVLVSNPPYVAKDADLEPNLAFEPDLALFGGDDGMALIERLIESVAQRGIGLFCCEMGYDQRAAVLRLLPAGYRVEFYKDLAGLDRGFIMTKEQR